MVHEDCRATDGTSATATTGTSASARPAATATWASAQTRGTAMSPVDHPHGGGEGATGAGRAAIALGRAQHGRLPHPQPAEAVRPLIVRSRRRGKK